MARKGQNIGRSEIESVCSDMTIFDLTKATVTCGILAFLIYSFPVVGQILIIGCLTVLWLSYARKTIASFLRR